MFNGNLFIYFQVLDCTDPNITKSNKPSLNNNHITNSNNDDQNSSTIVANNNEVIEDRRAPEGKDNDSILDNQLMDTKEKTYTTDVNGKVTVHVVVTINGNGTLQDLKNQRKQIRDNSNDINSYNSPGGSILETDSVSSPSTDIVRFTGTTTDENLEYTKPKRCCVIQ